MATLKLKKDEVEVAAAIMRVLLRGGDAAVLVRSPAGLRLASKIIDASPKKPGGGP